MVGNLNPALLRFTKMHGLGNDFVVIDSSCVITPEIARKICDRQFGVGADQLLWVREPSEATRGRADARMDIFNPDGSVAEMCGNGIRAVTLHLFGAQDLRQDFVIETPVGLKKVRIRKTGPMENVLKTVRVDMGVPRLGGGFEWGGTSDAETRGEVLKLVDDDFPKRVCQWLKHREVRFYEVNMGNPHAVLFLDSLEKGVIEALGAAIEVHPRFPHRTNVEFATVKDPHILEVQVWERGAGVTLACGTGACAVAVAAITTGQAKSPVRVGLRGGWLSVEWAGAGHSVFMEGTAEETYRGEVDLARLMRIQGKR